MALFWWQRFGSGWAHPAMTNVTASGTNAKKDGDNMRRFSETIGWYLLRHERIPSTHFEGVMRLDLLDSTRCTVVDLRNSGGGSPLLWTHSGGESGGRKHGGACGSKDETQHQRVCRPPRGCWAPVRLLTGAPDGLPLPGRGLLCNPAICNRLYSE